MFERGFLMVNLWWIRGELWLVDGHFSWAKNMPRLRDLFLGFPFWETEMARDPIHALRLHGWDALRRVIGMETVYPRPGTALRD